MIDWVGSYCGAAPDAATWLLRWNTDPLVLVMLVAAAAGVAWRLVGARRDTGLAGMAALTIAFVSPICALSVALFSARSLHHLLIVVVAAPLLARALPVRRPLPPGAALALATITLWSWHLPTAYDAALSYKAIYWVMQASLLATAWLYWDAIGRTPAPVALPFVATGGAQMGLLGALLTFAPRPLYTSHLATTAPFGIGPLGDQQLAGLVMWVLGLVPYALAGMLLARQEWRRVTA